MNLVEKQANEPAVLGTCQVHVVHSVPWLSTLRALCDTGSQLNLITVRAARRLHLPIEKASTSLVGVDCSPQRSNGFLHIPLQLPGNNLPHFEKFHVVNRITGRLPFKPINLSQYPEFHNLNFADPRFSIPGEIDALLGISFWIRIIKNGIIKSTDLTFAAQQTLLGWVIYRSADDIDTSQIKRVLYVESCDSNKISNLTDAIQKFWQTEELPMQIHYSKDELKCENIFRNTHRRDSMGRYIVHLPFNDRIDSLGKSKSIALRQFYAMERKMQRNSEFKIKYHDFINEFLTLGHMTEVKESYEDGYYTPHHGVCTSNKFRVVFNASCPTTTGVALNECQLVGPKLQLDLADILMVFRSYEVAITVDVVKMFRQVLVAEQHQKYQKILFRFNTDGPVRVFQIHRVIYGQAAAPYLSVKAMQQCAIDYAANFPLGAKALLEAFYVDDGLLGADSPEEAIQLATELNQMMLKGHFELAKWASNKNIFDGESPEFLEIKDQEILSVLGLRWRPKQDTLIYTIQPQKIRDNWTKREVLSEIGKLFDPNGYLAPVVITAKILMQRIWQEKCDWDNYVSSLLTDQWNDFISQLPDLQKIKIPRWLGMKKIWKSELHAFSDASSVAYAAVVYIKTVRADGSVAINLVQSKTKVAPLKTLTIPRLELCGAYILAKLADVVIRQFSKQLENCYFWTDSEIVLWWLQKSPSQLKTFVANRVAAIQTKTTEKGFQWNWVAGEQNPADLASRGINPSKLVKSRLWWNGPQWLEFSQEEWPKQPLQLITLNDESQTEMKVVAHVTESEQLTKGPWFKYPRNKQKAFPFIKSFSSFNKLKRVTATVLRALFNFKNAKAKRVGPLSTSELRQATFKLIHIDQHYTFPTEISQLKDGEQDEISASMWLDSTSNLLRLSGRVQNENLTIDEMHPIVLSPKGDLASLIIRDAHLLTLHGGVQQTLQMIRQQFWIFKARQLAKTIIHNCPTCFRYKIKLSEQLMAALPVQRTKPQRPFSVCGVDYMGPVGICSKIGRNPVISKAYVAVFVCFSTRAIHLELVSDASTKQFMQALRRMIARRGAIRQIWSDNGTNFVGTNNFLQSIYKKQDEWAYGSVASEFKIDWKFNTPYAPHHGGLHEAAVKSAKHHLKRVIGAQNLTFEEYATLLSQVEACLNSRPLNPLSDDQNDLTALTPAHFLVGEQLVTLTEPENLNEINPGRLTRWELVQQMNQHFWQRWQAEYIESLSQRSKWRDKERNIEVGDLVLLKEDNLAPSHWLLGRVKQIFPAPDGLVRSVLVSTVHGDYKRPITKMGVLIANTKNPIELSALNAAENYKRLTKRTP